MTDTRETDTLRQALAEGLQQRGVVQDSRIAEAFYAIPRHLFLPDVDPQTAYSDQAILTKEQDGVWLSSSSQPSMMAIMLQQLLVEPGQRILEIGAGTGYNAALLRYLVGPTGQITTVDVDDDIVAAARSHLATVGYDDVQVILGDGGYGYAPNAPYDGIILTVGAADVLPAWVEQLRTDGLLILPLQLGTAMYSLALRKLADGQLISESLAPCGFIALRGAFASTMQTLTLDSWQISLEPGPHLDPAQLPTLLAQPQSQAPLPADVAAATLFLSFTGEPMVRLIQRPADRSTEGVLIRDGFADTVALSACFLPPWSDASRTAPPARALLFGSRLLYENLLRWLEHWARLGRPGTTDLRILVTPTGLPLPPIGHLALARPHAHLALTSRDGRFLPRTATP